MTSRPSPDTPVEAWRPVDGYSFDPEHQHCEKCKSPEVLFRPAMTTENQYRCSNCKHSWFGAGEDESMPLPTRKVMLHRPRKKRLTFTESIWVRRWF